MNFSLFGGVAALLLAFPVQAASDSAATSKENDATSEAPATVEGASSQKAETARHRRKVQLNAQRRARMKHDGMRRLRRQLRRRQFQRHSPT